MDEDEIRTAAALISNERLAAFLAITGTERDALALHDQTMQLAGALMPIIGIIEIALRNAACERLRATFAVPDWLTNPPAPFQWKGDEDSKISQCARQAQRDAYAKKSQAEKKALDAQAFPRGVPVGISHEDRSKARQRAIAVTTGQLVAHLTFFFWKRLFSADYEDALWKRSLKRLFPNKTVTRAQVATHLEAVYQARNRIAHHEPVYGARLQHALEAVDFLAENFAAASPSPDAILYKMLAVYRPALKREVDALNSFLIAFKVTPTP